MDQLIRELGVSYDDLYKIHTGHNVNNDSDDSSSDTGSLDKDYKPPPYSLQEITQNMAVFCDQTHTDLNDKYRTLANSIMNLLTPSFCYVCNVTAQSTHYNLKEHNQALETYITNIVNNSELDLKDTANMICFACHAIFLNTKCAEIHYNSSGHESKIRKFCNVCLQHLTHHSDVKHYQQSDHKTLAKIRKMKTERIQTIVAEKNKMTNSRLSEIFVQPNRSMNNFKIHGFDFQVIRDIIEGKMDESVQCAPIPLSAIELMTPIYCFICNKSALKNGRGIFRHYTYMSHIETLKQFIYSQVTDSGIGPTNVESIYCDVCNILFLNSQLANQHYSSSEHKTMDASFGGQKSKKKSISLVAPLIKQPNNDSLATKEEAGIVIAEKLKDLLSPSFCFICKKHVFMHIFNDHYLGRQHTIKLRNWINNEIKISGVQLDKSVLYCEDCSLELGGTNEDSKHYETAVHQLNKNTYCSICVFRGTPKEVFEHIKTKQHKENAMKVSKGAKNGDDSPACYEDIKSELNKLLKTVYIVRALPLEQSLQRIKELNKILGASLQVKTIYTDNKMPNKPSSESTGETKELLNSPSTSTYKEMNEFHETCPIEVTQQEYAKTKLRMEINRLKMVIDNTSAISPKLAFKLVLYFNQLLENWVISGFREFNISGLFTSEDNSIEFPTSEDIQVCLQEKINKLSHRLLNTETMDVEKALEFVTQSNVELESFLQYQKLQSSTSFPSWE